MKKIINLIKNNKKNFGLICVLLFSAGLLVCGLSLAFFTSRDEVTNEVQASEINIKLFEPKWVETGMAKAATMEPGMTIEKDPYVYNDSNDEVYIRMKIVVKIPDSTASDGYRIIDQTAVSNSTTDSTDNSSSTGDSTSNGSSDVSDNTGNTDSAVGSNGTDDTSVSNSTSGGDGTSGTDSKSDSKDASGTDSTSGGDATSDTDNTSGTSTIELSDSQIYNIIINSIYCNIDGKNVNLIGTDKNGNYISNHPKYVLEDGWFYYKDNSQSSSTDSTTDSSTDNSADSKENNSAGDEASSSTDNSADSSADSSATELTYIKVASKSNTDTLFDCIIIPVLKSEYIGVFDSGLQIEVIAQAVSATTYTTETAIKQAFEKDYAQVTPTSTDN
jgi:hypothetical protein